MERKIFYTIIQKSGIVGVKRQDGFEIKIGETTFNAYTKDDGTVFIIDPKNGISLFEFSGCRDFDDDELVPDITKVERAVVKLKKSDVLKKWRELTEKESYSYTVKMFNALMDAQRYREKQKELVEKEKDEKLQMIAK